MIYPKLTPQHKCKYPERKQCNYDVLDNDSKRCEFMKYDKSKTINDVNRWHCTYLQNVKKVNEKD